MLSLTVLTGPRRGEPPPPDTNLHVRVCACVWLNLYISLAGSSALSPARAKSLIMYMYPCLRNKTDKIYCLSLFRLVERVILPAAVGKSELVG